MRLTPQQILLFLFFPTTVLRIVLVSDHPSATLAAVFEESDVFFADGAVRHTLESNDVTLLLLTHPAFEAFSHGAIDIPEMNEKQQGFFPFGHSRKRALGRIVIVIEIVVPSRLRGC